jgi:hypothetical protein
VINCIDFNLNPAHCEGWTIDLDEVQGKVKVLRIDAEADSIFFDDATAADHVHGCAEAGEHYHQSALDYIDACNVTLQMQARINSKPVRRTYR